MTPNFKENPLGVSMRYGFQVALQVLLLLVEYMSKIGFDEVDAQRIFWGSIGTVALGISLQAISELRHVYASLWENEFSIHRVLEDRAFGDNVEITDVIKAGGAFVLAFVSGLVTAMNIGLAPMVINGSLGFLTSLCTRSTKRSQPYTKL